MRSRAGLLLIILALVPLGSLRADNKHPDVKREVKFLRKVNDAIDRGAIWLVGKQQADGSWPGYERQYPMGATSLALLTLLNCDYPRDSKVVKKAFSFLIQKYDEQKPARLKTYSIALLMMALEEAYAPFRSQPVKRDGRYARDPRLRRVKLPRPQFRFMAELAHWVVQHQTATGWRYPRGGVDNSNTQFALLGLSSARRCGVAVSYKVFLRAGSYLLDQQEKDGPRVRRVVHVDQGSGYATRYATNIYDHARGWGYVPGRPATGSMTTACVASLAICRSELLDWEGYKGRFGARMERGIADGLAWLNVHFTIDRNPGGGFGWHYYYLYGLERAGVLADVTFMGDHDWYREGADFLVGMQARNGSWPGRRSSLTDTCFALLFLRRATVPVKVPPPPVTPGATQKSGK